MKQPLLTILTTALLIAPAFAGESWPRFRGPDGSGVAEGEKPPVEFGPDKNLLWSTPIAESPSSPCIWGDAIFLTTFDGGKLWTVCLDRGTGKERWRRDAKAEKIEAFLLNQGNPAASTPATDGKRVIVYFGSCGLVAYDFAGEELWRHVLPVAETNNDFGTGTSPILVDGHVVLVRDVAKGSSILAVDAETGKQKWRVERLGMATGYSTPVAWSNNGVTEIVAPGGLLMKSYDLRSGAERWLVRNLPAVNCGSPVVGDGELYFSSWAPAGEDAPMPDFSVFLTADDDKDGKLSKKESEKTPLKDFFSANDSDHDGYVTDSEWNGMVSYLKRGKNRLIAVNPGGNGDITDTHVAWERVKGLPYVPSVLYYRGQVFVVKDGGLASSFDAKTGTPAYEQKRLGLAGTYYASPVAADGRIYLATLEGKVATISAGNDPQMLWQADFGEKIAATPAIVENTLYVRSATKLSAFREGK